MLLDLTPRAILRVTGADRVRFLNGQLTNDITRLAVGNSLSACALTAKGKLCADLFVSALPDALLLDADPTLRENLAQRLERYIIADDVTLEDLSDELCLFHLLDSPLLVLPDDVITVRSNRFRQDGIDLFYAPAARSSILALFSEPPLSPGEMERLRVQRGIPKWGQELNEDIIPTEAGLDQTAISFTKGCYVGQEVISRIKSVGHVNKQLCGVRGLGGFQPTCGDQLLSADGKEIGKITSTGQTAAGAVIALAYLRRGFQEPGNRFQVRRNGNSLGSVEVESLPFVLA